MNQQFVRAGGGLSAGGQAAGKLPVDRGGAMAAVTKTRWRAGIVALAPAVLLAGLGSHPYIANPSDKEQIAAALTSGMTRWAISHIAVGVGSGLLALAFLAIRSYLSDAGEQRSSVPSLPLIIMGSTLFAMLPAMELGVLAGAEAGANVAAAQEAVDKWFIPTLVGSSLLFLLGSVGFARAIVRSGALPSGLASFVGAALIFGAIVRFVPLGASLYVGGAAVAAALWPIAFEMGKRGPDGS